MTVNLAILMALQILAPFVALAEIEFYDRSILHKKIKVVMLSALTIGYLLIATLLAMHS